MLAAVILAAGGSSRMGRPKQLLKFRGTSLLRRAIDTAQAVPTDQVIVAACPAELPLLEIRASFGMSRLGQVPCWNPGSSVWPHPLLRRAPNPESASSRKHAFTRSAHLVSAAESA